MLCTESLTAESLHSRLLAGTLKVVDVLREKAAMLAVKRRNREISTFVAKNIAGLLHEALFGGSATVRETAMKLISFNNKTIIGAICDCEELEKIASELLQSDEPDWRTTGSFAKIIEECLNMYPETIETNFGFICDFLKACDQSDVLDLFESLISPSRNLAYVSESLHRMGLVKKAAERIEEYLETGDTWKVVGLYRILLKCTANSEFESDLNSPEMLLFVTKHITSDHDERIQALQWKLMWTLLSEDNVTYFENLVVYAVEIATLDENRVTERQVEAINFLSHFCGLDNEATRTFAFGELVDGLIRVFEKHRNHTFVNGAICQFMLTCLEVDDLRNEVVSKFFPVVVSAFHLHSNRVQGAFTLEFGRQVVEACETDEQMEQAVFSNEEFAQFCHTKVALSASILKRDYGKKAMSPIIAKVPPSDITVGIQIDV